MPRPKPNKAVCQQVHARRRIEERFGVRFVSTLAIVDDIQAGRLRFIRKQSNRVSLYETEFEGKPAVVVYDRHRKVLVTAYPLEWLDQPKS